jgi:hypothetical protein
MAGSLRSDLLDIPGIEAAEIEGDVLTPAGVKVRLAPGADAARVSEQVQKVLAAHGLSSELSAGDRASQSTAPPERILAAAPEPKVSPPGGDETEDDRGAAEDIDAHGEEHAPSGGEEQAEPPLLVIEHSAPLPRTTPRFLSSIAVEEDHTGVAVVATADEETATRRARPDGRGLDEAVVAAVCALFDPDLPVPVVVSISDQQVEGSAVLTVVLDVADRRVAGSTIVEGGRPYAVGLAAWAALSAR